MQVWSRIAIKAADYPWVLLRLVDDETPLDQKDFSRASLHVVCWPVFVGHTLWGRCCRLTAASVNRCVVDVDVSPNSPRWQKPQCPTSGFGTAYSEPIHHVQSGLSCQDALITHFTECPRCELDCGFGAPLRDGYGSSTEVMAGVLKQLLAALANTTRMSNMHLERLLAQFKAATPFIARRPTVERYCTAALLAQYMSRFVSRGFKDSQRPCTVVRYSSPRSSPKDASRSTSLSLPPLVFVTVPALLTHHPLPFPGTEYTCIAPTDPSTHMVLHPQWQCLS
jgi:hypothetical protein